MALRAEAVRGRLERNNFMCRDATSAGHACTTRSTSRAGHCAIRQCDTRARPIDMFSLTEPEHALEAHTRRQTVLSLSDDALIPSRSCAGAGALAPVRLTCDRHANVLATCP
jgi:hypothetical protein